MNAIELRNISKSYRQPWGRGTVKAVIDLSLTVPAGEAFGFIGANGAGKSTTIKVMVGALRLDSGHSALFGIDTALPESRRQVSFVPENPSLSELMTPMEIIDMALAFHGVKVDAPRRHAMQWLEKFRIAHVADKLVRGFSKGMLQRTVLAQALAVQPRLLILDEPLSGLDPIGRKEVVDILEDYKRDGGTIFFTSHVLHDVERIADRFGLIHLGRMHSVQSPAELVNGQPVVSVRSIGERALPFGAHDGGGRWACEVNREQLWQTLEQLRGLGHTVIEVRPVMNLERLFLNVVESTGAPVGV
jgi:ABC-2 type transport system ATP-binding protein